MERVWLCLQTQHDWRLVGLAAVVCFLTCLAAFSMFQRANAARGIRYRTIWLCVTGFITGCGIWSTHFIAMLAFMPGIPVSYDPTLTVLSLLIASAMVTAGFAAAMLSRKALAAPLGGLLIGAGIGGMHYTGIASMEMSAVVELSAGHVVWSVALGMIFASLALLIARTRESARTLFGAAAILELAIVSHHFVSIGGLTLLPISADGNASASLPSEALAFAIAAVVAIAVLACLIGALVDRRIALSARNRNLQLNTALNNMSQGLYMFGPDRTLQLWNQRFAEIYRIAPDRLWRGMTMDDMQRTFIAAGTLAKNFKQYVQEIRAAFAAGQPANCLIELKDGRSIHANFNLMPNGGWVGTHEDITERLENRARMEHLAKHDALTGLPNRLQFDEQLRAVHERKTKTGRMFAVLALDLDDLKAVNDDLGQAAGDAVIVEAANRFAAICEKDTLFRLGNDEFAVINVGPQPASAEKLSKRLLDALKAPLAIGPDYVRLGCTIGISVYPLDGDKHETLMSNATTAMFEAKKSAKGGVSFFEKEMDEKARTKREMQKELTEAIARDQLQLHFQPQAKAHTRSGVKGAKVGNCSVVAFEVLLRWRHPRLGNVPPGVFIPLAEDMGLIPVIDEWVLREACREAASWKKPLGIAVNLSPETFRRRDIPRMIHSALAVSGLAPGRLEIEITEGVLMRDFITACDALRRIKALGVRIALDDFGTGYSSLSYLQAFPFDMIKIDQTFVANLPDKAASIAIVKSVIGLGHGLGLPVIAEGVETQEQLDFLRAQGCDQVQGYFIGRPQPIETYAELVCAEAGTENDSNAIDAATNDEQLAIAV